MSAYELEGFEHRDPADRLLVAAAVDLKYPMVTYDRKIVDFGYRHGGRNGFAIAEDWPVLPGPLRPSKTELATQ